MTKEQFITDLFRIDFPNYNYSYKVIQKLTSRSGKMAKWMEGAKAQWEIYSVTPEYFKDVFTEGEYSQYRDKVQAVSELRSKEGLEIRKLSDKFSSELKAKQAEYKTLHDPYLNDDTVFVLCMNTQFLPFEQQILLIEKEPEDRKKLSKDAKEELAVYEAKILNDFKRARLQEVKDGTFVRSQWEIK